MNLFATSTTALPSTGRVPRTASRLARTVVRAGLVTALAAGALGATAGASEARTGTWYSIPSFNGATGGAIMTTFSKTYASGYASGSVWLRSNGQNLYIQFKPNEGGLWNRLSKNQTTSAALYYNWSDSFTLNYTGFMSRICKDNTLVADTCGSAVKIYG